jgi:hypothetical protein
MPRLASLNNADLNGSTAEFVVKLDGVDGGHGLFILAAFTAL